MTVHRGTDALRSLRDRLGPPPRPAGPYVSQGTVPDAPDMGTATPPGFEAAPPRDWLWATGQPLPRLRDPAAYRSTDADASLLSRAPAQLARTDLSDRQKEAYCRSSADVTMRGGTTSGVVYPLAVCEIARTFRLRNVGGASAGAIAASMAAAAEVARASGVPDRPVPEDARRRGHVRPGFAGLADAMAWLCGLDDRDPQTLEGPEEHRLARLFRPSRPGRHVFRVAEAYWLRQWVRLPFLVVRAAGRVPAALVAGAVVLAALLLADVGAGDRAGTVPLATAALGLLGLVGLAMIVLGGVPLLLGTLVRRRGTPPGLADPVVPPAPRDLGATLRRLGPPAAVTALGSVGVAACLRLAPVGPVPLLGVGAGLGLTVVLVVGAGVARILGRAKAFGYGVVAGADEPGPPRTGRGRATPDDRAVVTWLSDTLNELSGLTPGPSAAGPVLRFGHLWCGLGYDPAAPGDAVRMAELAHHRIVNLELITTELVQRRAYRFPLAPSRELAAGDGSTLYLSVEDLTDPDRPVVPADVREVLLHEDDGARTPRPRHPMRDIRTGASVTLVALPEPWNVPVVLAVRLSMSLPGLFQAVRMYREVQPVPVRDEFGRRLTRDGEEVRYPAGAGRWCEQLWFTDGGVTSNFPIHFFDSPLPLWPTFGINLGPHAPGLGSQDVWVPQDWDPQGGPTHDLRDGMAAFLSAIVGTARGWRDTEQTFMPGSRGRVAWVHQLPTEGGSNLHMDSATIASLALRGVVAGARLRRRFGDPAYWRRSQWIRMRTAVGTLGDLTQVVTRSRARLPYSDLGDATGAADALDRLTGTVLRGDPHGTVDPGRTPTDDGAVPWYRPAPADEAEYWRAVQALLDGMEHGARPPDDPLLRRGVPQPSPVLRQVPRV